MTYFSERLPSNGEKTVNMREYTLKDATIISSMNPKLKERVITRFLNEIQTGEDIIDPKDMTVQDRRTLLFKYALVSLEEEILQSPEVFTIQYDDGEHKIPVSLIDFIKTSPQSRVKTNTEIETEFNGQRLLVTPIKGVHAEQLESFDNKLAALEEKHGVDSDEYQEVRVKRELHELLCQFTLVDSSEKPAADQAEQDKTWLESLSFWNFQKVKNLVARKQLEIDHGIDFSYSFERPDKKGEPVAVLLPFRFDQFIPRI